ncbi:MAG TPA: glycosyltransferase family 2 protein [Candidatus Brocadiaceae bacterium]
MSGKRFSIIIPCYNEEKAIGKVLKELTSLPEEYEIIVINDGSSDRSSEIIQLYKVKVITHPYQKGYGASLKDGISSASSNALVFFDGDGQHHASDIGRFIAELDTYDFVIGSRISNETSPIPRRPGKTLLTWVAQILTGKKISDLNCGFRAVKKNIIQKYLHLLPQGFSFSTTMTLIGFSRGYNVTFLPIATTKRIGKSTVSMKDGINTLLLIIRFITLFNPLKIFFPVSSILFLIGILWSIPYLLTGKGLTVASLFLLFTSITVFFFGILADQISQLRLEKYE